MFLFRQVDGIAAVLAGTGKRQGSKAGSEE